jgi:glycogen debranching enzyme
VRSNNAVLDVDLTNPDFTRDGIVELAKDTVHISRTKFLWNAACYELLAIRNFGEQRLKIRVAFEFDADFVDLFEVRGFPARSRGAVRASLCQGAALRFDYASLDNVARLRRFTSRRLRRSSSSGAPSSISTSRRSNGRRSPSASIAVWTKRPSNDA